MSTRNRPAANGWRIFFMLACATGLALTALHAPPAQAATIVTNCNNDTELQALLDGKNDPRNAFVQIHAGAGGTGLGGKH